MKTFVWVAIIAMLSGVILYQQSQKHVEAQPVKVRTVTASEEFRLRGECVKLADKMTHMGDTGPALISWMLSHYNPETNRCYVELTTIKNLNYDYPKVSLAYCNTTIFDGQTEELLVDAAQSTNDYNKDGSGNIWYLSRPGVTYIEAMAEIDKLMQGE